MHALEWTDKYYEDDERLVLTQPEIHIPGIRVLGRHVQSQALPALRPHYHKDCFEFTYIAKGKISFFTGGREYLLSGGDFFVSRPNEVHSSGGEPLSICEMYWLQLDIRSPAGLLYLAPPYIQNLVQGLSDMRQHVIAADTAHIRRLFENSLSLIRANEELGRMEAACSILMILYHLLHYAEKKRTPLTPDIQRAVAFIHANIYDYIKLEALADAADLSLPRFKQKFKTQVGTSPREYINSCKVEAAKKLLLTDLPVTDIAMQLHFDTSNYFSVVFKRFTTKTPSEYRKQHSLSTDHKLRY